MACAGAKAGAIDPATLHVGPGAGASCATGCGGDPNLLGGALTADVYQNSAGAAALTQPILLIIGVPNDTTDLFATSPILDVTAINAYPGGTITLGTAAFAAGGTYGLASPIIDGFFGTLGPGQEVYSFLSLSGNNSNSFTNWSAADLAYAGITASNYGIYVFALNANLGPHGLVDLSFSSVIPKGSIVLAYGEGGDKAYTTPFTEAGLKDGVAPEPTSLLLLGSGLAGLGGLLKRRRAS
jgi:PEP-CTERM motif